GGLNGAAADARVAAAGDLAAVIDGPAGPGGDGADARGAVGIVGAADHHEPEAPADARDAEGVVADGGGGARSVGAVPVDVVDLTAVDLGGLGCGVEAGHADRGEVGVGEIHARVDDADDDRGLARGGVPGLRGLDAGQVPLIGVARVVGDGDG